MVNIFDIDWSNVGKNLMFWRWRRNASGDDSMLLAYIRSVMASIQVLSNKLLSLRNETFDFLQYTGQDKVLEELLNDTFDSVQRRIYITENDIGQLDALQIGLSNETVPSDVAIGLSGETITVPIVLGLSNEALQGNNFTIHIPVVVVFNLAELTALVKNYSLAAKNFNVTTF